MAIDVNQLNVSPLAAVAGNQVPRLGLQPYSIDAGALLTGQAKGQLLQAQMQMQTATLLNQQKVQDMRNQGLLTKAQYDNAMSAIQKDLDRQNQLQIAQGNQALTAQANANTAQHYANQDATAAFGAQNLAGYRQGTLAINQQNANQTGAYQQGVLQNQQDANATNKLKIQLEQAANEKKETLQQMAQLGSATNTIISSIKDPKQQQQALNGLFDQADQMGIDTSKYRQMNPQQLSQAATAATLLGHFGLAMKDQQDKTGQTVALAPDGTMTAVPASNKDGESGLDKELNKAYANIFQKASDNNKQIGILQNSLNAAIKLVQATPEDMVGPVAGLYTKYYSRNPEQIQALDSALKDITLQMKNVYNMGSQGFTDSDRKFLEAVTGGLQNYKGSLQEILQRIQTITSHQQAANWLDQYEVLQGSDKLQNWLKFNPEPQVTIVNAKTGEQMAAGISNWAQHHVELQKNGWDRND